MIDDICEKPTVDIAVEMLRLRRIGRLVVDHNPFYLLSGVCMLFGCFAINKAVHDQSEGLARLVLLIGVFNVYEWLVIGLGLGLARRGLLRDAGYLLGIEALLLVDLTFLYNECITEHLVVGAAVSSAALVLTVIKVAVIVRGLGLRLGRSGWLLIVLDFAVLFALPGLLRELESRDLLTPMHQYGVWWSCGLLLAMHGMMGRWPADASGMPVRLQPLARIRWALAVLPPVAVIIHALAAHYVYGLPLHLVHLTPIVFGFAAVWAGLFEFALPARLNRRIAVLLSVTGIMLSWRFPAELMAELTWPGELTITPFRLALIGAAMLHAPLWWRLGSRWLAAVGFGYGVVALVGHSPAQIGWIVRYCGRMLIELWQWLIPTALIQWGAWAVAAAFGLLGIGALLSLGARRASSMNEAGD